MNSSNYTYSPKASVFRKSYDTVHLTIILEELASGRTKDKKEAVQMLKDEIDNFLNDSEKEEIFKPKAPNKSRQDKTDA